jgi:hypothetical protein
MSKKSKRISKLSRQIAVSAMIALIPGFIIGNKLSPGYLELDQMKAAIAAVRAETKAGGIGQ